jgi:esterase/lipase superfamily enzyme
MEDRVAGYLRWTIVSVVALAALGLTSCVPKSRGDNPNPISAPVSIATADRTSKCDACAVSPPVRPSYRVWFGTNRKPNATFDDFTEQRDDTLHLGYCDVYVPSSHVFGELGSSWIVRVLQFDDDRLKVDGVMTISQESFQTLLSEELDKVTGGDKAALVYIHGYNNSFKDAATRAAQIGYDLKVDGITAFFSWPSRASPAEYVADGSAIDASERQLKQFLKVLSANPEVRRLDILAHSMGNRALIRIVSELRADATIKPIRNIILAAPDVDLDVFKQLAVDYPKLSTGRTTLYVSSKDRAVRASEIINDYPRAGYAPPMVVLNGIDTVEASSVDFGLIGHGYYAESDALLHDMFDILHHGDPPANRQRLREIAGPSGSIYWKFR